jgi:hypothetical protein
MIDNKAKSASNHGVCLVFYVGSLGAFSLSL